MNEIISLLAVWPVILVVVVLAVGLALWGTGGDTA